MHRYSDEMAKRIETEGASDELRAYHAQRISEFQHERLVHLLIMLFFGGLALLFVGVFLWVLTLGATLLTILAGVLAVLIFVLELFYIAYYYRLENGVQKLYALTERLYQSKN